MGNPYLVLGLLVGYFAVLFIISRYTAGKGDNEAFFSANRNSKWYLVAFGMIGTSLSGVTFISVPGQVGQVCFSYFQVVLGYIVGYAVIALVLMPLYYRLNLVSIYGYLKERLGYSAFKTGAWFFLVSRALGSAARFYLVMGVLHLAVFEPLGVPFAVTVVVGLMLIWLYTYQGGVKTIIVTDSLQTGAMLLALGLSLYLIAHSLNTSVPGLVSYVIDGAQGQIFFWDWHTADYFPKQFLSGAFIAIVMTGLDQDMMQKNLTCRNLREAQTNMFSFTAIMVAVNFLFLVLGGALWLYMIRNGIPVPTRLDQLFPTIALSHLGTAAAITFLLGIIAATYASTDSALTALTTSYCIDILEIGKKPADNPDAIRKYVHLGFTAVLFILVLVFRAAGTGSLITVVFTLAGYTYGPLLGMFGFGILTQRPVRQGLVPVICILSPLLCYLFDFLTKLNPHGYRFGFELLILNGALVYTGLYLSSIGMAGSSSVKSQPIIA